MNYQLIVNELARDDLAEAREWYESKQTGLGDRFRSAIDSLFKRIEWNPKMYASGYRGVRAAKHPRFPYVIRYQIKAP